MTKMVVFKKSTYCKNFTTQTCLEQSALLPQKLKLFSTFGQYHVKAEGRSIPKQSDIINLREKLLSELRQCSFTAP